MKEKDIPFKIIWKVLRELDDFTHRGFKNYRVLNKTTKIGFDFGHASLMNGYYILLNENTHDSIKVNSKFKELLILSYVKIKFKREIKSGNNMHIELKNEDFDRILDEIIKTK